ncbi:FMN-binding negative transcriptional regulator [Actinacidiphila soli]|uniref:FMN-binding negative transcriptional regulator n=1 Tax=Actinacidiphila soli TaxID=2487275 RepID=UPI001F0CB519|nr:FMN-binding negative transcriptional regulator [Actinacidiphila soli]
MPPIYASHDHTRLQRVVRGHPLAILVTNGPRAPYATHLPVVDSPRSRETDDPVGTTLLGHMNRANPHWASLSDEMSARLVFSGPQSYITPTLYQTTPAAPTWDFVAVHLEGTLRLLDGLEETLRVVRRTVEVFEHDFGADWDMEPSLEYFRQIAVGVGAFEFRVTAAESMFKLSQEKDATVRERIAENVSPEIAALISDLSAKEPS